MPDKSHAALSLRSHRLLAAELKALEDENVQLKRRLDAAENYIAGTGSFERYREFLKRGWS